MAKGVAAEHPPTLDQAQTRHGECKARLEERTRELHECERDLNPAYLYTPQEVRSAAHERLPTVQAEVQQATADLAEAQRDLGEATWEQYVAGLPAAWAAAERTLHDLYRRREPLEQAWQRANAITSKYGTRPPQVTEREEVEAEIREPELRREWRLLSADIADAEKELDRVRGESIATWRAEFREQKIKQLKVYDELLQQVARVHDRLVAIEEAENQKCGTIERLSLPMFDRPTSLQPSWLHDRRDHWRQEGLLA